MSKRSVIAVLVLGLVPACASAPRFTPSRPIEEAGSLQESLLLCNEYRLPAPAARPVALRPYRDCVEKANELYPPPPQSSFRIFRDELALKYDLLREPYWSPLIGDELEVAIHTALRALWREGRRQEGEFFTPIEREMMLRHFPWTAQALGASAWPISVEAALDPKLESLKASVRSLSENENELSASAASVLANVDRAELCERFRKLRSETDYLSRLWQDQYDMTHLAPRSEAGASVRAKYGARLDAALLEVESLRPKIADARANLGFRVLSCY